MKWAGGKAQLLPELVARSPRSMGTYYEPFIGGGAVFFALMADPDLAPRRAVLNDLNRNLIDAYTVVRDDPGALMARLSEVEARYLAADAGERAILYYQERARQPGDAVDVAARFIFLNKTCFNGLYRVNRRGEFNVPHGRYARPRILDAPAIEAASAALQDVELRCGDFEAALAGATAGDFVYLDPPFEPLSKTSSFTSYTEGSFDRAQQLRLRRLVDELTDRGVAVMLSNSPAEWLVGVYEGAFRYQIDRIPARRAINSRGDRRGAIDELVITNYPPESARGHLPSV